MKPKTAVVTGGAKGIGRACCEKLAKLGYTVYALDVDDAAGAQLTAQMDGIQYRHCDVSSRTQTQQVLTGILQACGTVTVLVNNAGIQTHRLFVDMEEHEWDRTINVNLKSAFYTSRLLAPGMVAAGFGRIVNMASMSARRGSYRHVHYCTSKAALLGFTRALSLELAPDGVTVNAICPGIVETDIVAEYLEQKRASWLAEMHVKRLGTPEDIANALAFLVREESGWISGQALDVNGGILTP